MYSCGILHFQVFKCHAGPADLKGELWGVRAKGSRKPRESLLQFVSLLKKEASVSLPLSPSASPLSPLYKILSEGQGETPFTLCTQTQLHLSKKCWFTLFRREGADPPPPAPAPRTFCMWLSLLPVRVMPGEPCSSKLWTSAAPSGD